MAIAFVQGQRGGTGGATSVAVALTGIAAGNLLVVWAGTFGAGHSITGVSDGVNTWAGPVFTSQTGTNSLLQLWYAMNVAAGSTTVTMTLNVSTFGELHVLEYSGAALTLALDKSAVGSSAAGATTYSSGTTATTSQASEMVVAAAINSSGATFSLPSGYNLRENDISALRMQSWDLSVSSTGAQNASGTMTSSDYAAGIATFVPPSDNLPPGLGPAGEMEMTTQSALSAMMR